jgi:hypothetical protein
MRQPSHSCTFITQIIAGGATDHEAPHYVVFSTPLLPRPSQAQYFLSTLFSNTLNLRSSLRVRDQVSRPYKTVDKAEVLYAFIFMFLDSKLEDKIFFRLEINHRQ